MVLDEFDGLPPLVKDALEERLAEVLRLIYGRYNASLRDYSVKNFSGEQLSAMIFGVFDAAAKIKSKLDDNPLA
jgi:hypothetical protein